MAKNNRKIIKFTKSPQHKTITISTERHGFIGHINLRELKEFLDDEFTDIIEFTNDWETYYEDKK